MKILFTCLTAILLIFIWHANKQIHQDSKIVIGILQTASHPSLDAVCAHFKKTLSQNLNGQVRFIEQNGQGQISALQSMMNTLKRHQKIQLILSIATPATQVALLSEHERPILFTAVTDASILAITSNTTNVCGISDKIDADSVVEIIKRFFLPTQTVAILYNPSESHSIGIVNELSDKLKASHLTPLLIGALLPSEMPTAAQKAAREADLILAPTDNLVAMTLPIIAEACRSASKPLVGMDNIALDYGANAALGIDYAQMGIQAASMAFDILRGITTEELGLQTLEATLKTTSQ